MKALALSKDKTKEPAKNADVDTGIYGKYVRFQVPFKSRIEYLNKGQFEKPVAADGDKCTPRLHFDIKAQQGVQQPMTKTNYGILSCAFDAERIAAYGAANANFKEDTHILALLINLAEAGNLLRGNDALHAMLGARARARMQLVLVTMMFVCLIARLLV